MQATRTFEKQMIFGCVLLFICFIGLVEEGRANRRSSRPAQRAEKFTSGISTVTESSFSVINTGTRATVDKQGYDAPLWQWVHPFPIGQDFENISIAPYGQVYAITDKGLLVRYDGTRFDVFESPLRGSRASVFAVAADNVYLSVGENVAQFDGASFHMLPPTEGCTVHSLWADAGGTIVAVGDMGGDFGCVYRFENGDWTREIQFDQYVVFESVFGFNKNDLYIAGDKGSVLQYDGAGWTRMRTPTDVDFEDIYGTGPNNLYVAADSEKVLHYDGTEWTIVFDGGGPELTSVFASNNVWASFVSHDRTSYGFLFFDGATWQELPPVNDLDIWSIIGDAASNKVYAVGERGNFAAWTGDSFASLSRHLVRDTLFDSVTLGDEVVVWAGEKGTIMRVKDRTWTRENSPTTDTLLSVHGLAPDDIYASGNRGGIVHYNGKEWSISRTEPQVWEALNAVWAAAKDQVYAVGYSPERGAVYLRFDGANWNYFDPIPDRSGIPQKIWGNSRNDIFIVGTEGMILHFDGHSWEKMETNTADAFISVWGRSSNDVLAVTESTIYHYDGTRWTKMSTRAAEPTGLFTKVGGAPSGSVYIVTRQGEVLQLDREELTVSARLPSSPYMHSIAAIGNEIYVTGDEAAILRYGCLSPRY